MKTLMLSALGWFFLGLAILGAVLPLLPTTPFALLSLYFFSKSSPKMARWLLDHPWFGPTIRRWKENRTLAPKVKAWALSLLSFSMIISLWLSRDILWLSAFLWVTWLSLLFFLGRIPTTVDKDIDDIGQMSQLDPSDKELKGCCGE